MVDRVQSDIGSHHTLGAAQLSHPGVRRRHASCLNLNTRRKPMPDIGWPTHEGFASERNDDCQRDSCDGKEYTEIRFVRLLEPRWTGEMPGSERGGHV